jgi:S1-C subfamily serine protease
LVLGGYRFRDVLADFAAETSPFVGEEGTHGLIGTGVLRRFKVAFDYSRRQMILEPNRFFTARFMGSSTGFSYTRVQPAGTLRLTGVLPGSPAQAARLRAGDEIVQIDGRSASEFTDDQLYRAFRASGRRMTLVVRREGKELRTRLRLRSFI